MKLIRILGGITVLCAALITAAPLPAEELQSVDNGIWAELLSRHVKEGVVDYRGFKEEEARLDGFLEHLATARPEAMERREMMAFYINLYNAWTVKLVLGGYPGVESIKELGTLFKSPWERKIVRVDGRVITLDDVEHRILRPRFKDPRVHFAINCASRSCPPLLSEPYEGRILDRQLDDAAAGFLNDPRRNRLEGGVLHASSIFKWFGEDFGGDIVGFFRRYARGELKERLAQEKSAIAVRYLDYDWSLNDR